MKFPFYSYVHYLRMEGSSILFDCLSTQPPGPGAVGPRYIDISANNTVIVGDIRHVSTIHQYSISKPKPTIIDGAVVTYKEKQYAIVGLRYKLTMKYFVCDYDDIGLIYDKQWHISSGKYVGKNFILSDGTIKEIYIHNYLMNMPESIIGEKKYVVHINNNTLDNRRANLKIIREDELQNHKAKRKRTIQLPEDSTIDINEIPRYVSYMKATGHHSDRFTIEMPKLGIFWKSSSSKKKTLRDKLNETLERITELKTIYPDHFIEDITLSNSLSTEFEEIMKLAGVDISNEL